MKKIFMFWICISVVMTFLFGFTFMSRDYFSRFQNFPNFLDIFKDLMQTFSNVTLKFKNVHDLISFFEAVGAVFGFLFALLKLPFVLIGYLIKVINVILPYDLINYA